MKKRRLILSTCPTTPSPEEVEFEVQKEGSFILDRLETFEFGWIRNDGNRSVSEGVYPTSET